MDIEGSISGIRSRIAGACAKSHRDSSEITLVAVTKGVSGLVIRKAIELGIRDFGENRVQEAQEKIESIGRSSACWHMVGHLQKNKVRHAIELFDAIHSLDSIGLLDQLKRHTAKKETKINVLIQVNISGEDTKFGCSPEEALALARSCVNLDSLKLSGLMTIAPFSSDPEDSRLVFRGLRQLRDSLASSLQLPVSELKLSMGMSGDFEVAIEEGADIVRIGTAIFGERQS